MSPARAGATVAALALLAGAAAGHDLQHTVAPGQALVIQLRYADGSPFSFEAYEVYRADRKVPFQVGRTDQAGRIAFLPDEAATWRVKAFSEDGHGLDIQVESGSGSSVGASERPLYDRFGRITTGVAILLGLFGILQLFVRRHAP